MGTPDALAAMTAPRAPKSNGCLMLVKAVAANYQLEDLDVSDNGREY